MLTYEYKCINDGCELKNEVKEIRKKITEPHPNCLRCNEEMVRHYSAGNSNKIQLKGDGWFGSKHAIK